MNGAGLAVLDPLVQPWPASQPMFALPVFRPLRSRVNPCQIGSCPYRFRDKSRATIHERNAHPVHHEQRLRTVAAWARDGLTDRELAERLHVGRTVAMSLRQRAGVVRTPAWGMDWVRRRAQALVDADLRLAERVVRRHPWSSTARLRLAFNDERTMVLRPLLRPVRFWLLLKRLEREGRAESAPVNLGHLGRGRFLVWSVRGS